MSACQRLRTSSGGWGARGLRWSENIRARRDRRKPGESIVVAVSRRSWVACCARSRKCVRGCEYYGVARDQEISCGQPSMWCVARDDVCRSEGDSLRAVQERCRSCAEAAQAPEVTARRRHDHFGWFASSRGEASHLDSPEPRARGVTRREDQRRARHLREVEARRHLPTGGARISSLYGCSVRGPLSARCPF